MRFYRPTIDVPGDSEDRIMARTGEIVGYDHTHKKCLWRFGFLPRSQAAKAYSVSLPGVLPGDRGLACAGFVWVLAEMDGTPLDLFVGFGVNLPKEYDHIMQAGEPVDEAEWREADPYDV